MQQSLVAMSLCDEPVEEAINEKSSSLRPSRIAVRKPPIEKVKDVKSKTLSGTSRMPLTEIPAERRSTTAICASENNTLSEIKQSKPMPYSNLSRIITSDRQSEAKSLSANSRRTSSLSSSSSSSASADISKPPLFGSRAPEIGLKKKKHYNTQVTSVSSVIYDENWASKQTNSYTDWLNHIFFNSLGSNNSSGSQAGQVALGNSDVEGTGTGNASFEPDGCGLKELLNKRAEGVNRQKSSELHRKQSGVMKAVEQAVCDKSFQMRNDRDILVDLGLQDALLTILFSYEMSWIRLGLETVFGEIIPHPSSTLKSQKIYYHPCRTGCPKWKTTVKTFVLERMFTNQNQNQKSKYQTSTSSYDQNAQDITRECIVKKFFALILFLDAAKIQEILVIPTLFVVNSGMKSSKDVILAFSKGLLQGQGDVIKHLGQSGYSVSFIQSYVFEFNFTVSNLLTDLRDGVRLTRLMELLTRYHDKRNSTSRSVWGGISTQLRAPAGSRLQKLHNVGLALKSLYDHLDPPYLHDSLPRVEDRDVVQEAKDIVDGHRDATLLLLWKILYGCELRHLVDPADVKNEAERIASDGDKYWSMNNRIVRATLRPLQEVNELETVPRKTQNRKTNLLIECSSDGENVPGPFGDTSDSSALTSGLIKWCNAIARTHGLYIRNLTTCLADGRTLCFLIHHYHPTILPLSAVKSTTATILADHLKRNKVTVQDTKAAELEQFTEASASALSISVLSKADIKRAQEGERMNFVTIKKACNAIGGIPLMLPTHDTSDVPEARTMTVFLGYLFARLIESSSQIRAAIKIEKHFRLYRWRCERRQCATLIQRKYASYVQRRKYVVMIEEWREYKACCETSHSENGCYGRGYSEGGMNDDKGDRDYVHEIFHDKETEEDDVDEHEDKVEKEEEEVEEEGEDCNEDLWLAVSDGDYLCGLHVDDEKLYEEAERDRIAELLLRTTHQDEQCHAVDEDDGILSRPSYTDTADYSCHSDNDYNHALLEGEKVDGVDEECETSLYVRQSKEGEQGQEERSAQRHREVSEQSASSAASRQQWCRKRTGNKAEEDSVAVRCVDHGQLTKESQSRIDQSPFVLAASREVRSSRVFSKLHAHYLGGKVRSASTVEVKNLLTRIKESSKRASQNPLLITGSLTQASVKELFVCQDANDRLAQCITLEYTTRNSSRCCEMVTESGICAKLLKFLRSCNRSEEHEQLLRNCLCVLLHIARHDHLASVLAGCPDSADTIVDIMQMFRDKPAVFGKAAELISKLITASADIKMTCNTGACKGRLDGILHIVESRHRLDERVRMIQLLKAEKLTSLTHEIEDDKSHMRMSENTGRRSFGKCYYLANEEPLKCIQHVMQILELE